tara:strand:+ start:1745 stop:1960 length:216 start_codon:yes stop_codon:yes gene_type:complete
MNNEELNLGIDSNKDEFFFKEWIGMPEFVQPNREAKFSVTVHFESSEHLVEFSKLLNKPPTIKPFFFPIKK